MGCKVRSPTGDAPATQWAGNFIAHCKVDGVPKQQPFKKQPIRVKNTPIAIAGATISATWRTDIFCFFK
ncbi:hypothetical protein ES703_36763 [subsurface metagenome]